MSKLIKIEPPKPARLPLQKVAAYARVSKDTDQLLNSLSAQVRYYDGLIRSTPGWEYAGIYVDAGLTGTNTESRPEFRRMVEDCEAGKNQYNTDKIDKPLCPQHSRFAKDDPPVEGTRYRCQV